MTSYIMQALILGSSISVITALPFLNTNMGLQKVPDRDVLPEQHRDPSDDLGAYLSPDASDKWLYSQLYPNEEEFADRNDDIQDDGDDDEDADLSMDTISKRASFNRFYGVRGKRFSFGYYPFGFLRQYRNGRRRKYYPTMFVASRGKRQDMYNHGSNDDTPAYNIYGSPVSKRRRLGFTAVRGR